MQQVRESRQKMQDMENLLDLVGASVSPKEQLSTEAEASLTDSNLSLVDFVPETDRLDPLSAEICSDSQDGWQPKHNSFELEEALQKAEKKYIQNPGVETVSSTIDAARCPFTSSEDSLDGDIESRFHQLQSEHAELMVKANDLEEQVFKLSPSKVTGASGSGCVDMHDRVLDLEIERESLEQKIKEQRELFNFEKSDLQQKCHVLTLEVENLNLFKENLEQELESMSYAMEKKSRGFSSASENKISVITQTDLPTDDIIANNSVGSPSDTADRWILESRVNQLMARSTQYETVIADLKQQVKQMSSSSVLQELTQEVSAQDRMQEELLQEVRKVREENENLRTFIASLDAQSTLENKPSRGSIGEEGRSTDSLEARIGAREEVNEEAGGDEFIGGNVERYYWDVELDKASRQSLDSLEGGAEDVCLKNEDRSPDSLDDVSSLCDLTTSDVSSHVLVQALLHKQDAATETSLIHTVDVFSETEPGTLLNGNLQEKVYQLEMEKILLKAKVAKLEGDLQQVKDNADALPDTESHAVSSWAWQGEQNNHWNRCSSSSESMERERKHAQESSSMVESSSTLTSNSGGSLENLLDARFRERTAARYPVMNEASDSSSPAREASSYPSVFEDSGSDHDLALKEDSQIEHSLALQERHSSPSHVRSLDLTDELADLSKEMKETKDIFVREKALLQEALDREQATKDCVHSQIESFSEEEECSDVTQLRQKLALAQKTNRFLVGENEQWIVRVKQQEALVFQLRERLEETSESDESHGVLGQQLAILRDHRNELLKKLEEKLPGEKFLAQVIGEKSVLEENLRAEKELLAVKTLENDKLKSKFREQKVQLERAIQEQRFLEEKLYQKDESEKELMRQKRLLEEELYYIESKLKDREAQLEFEKSRLLHELKEKSLAIRRFEVRQNSTSLGSGHSSPRLSGSLTSVASSSGSMSRGDQGGQIHQMERVRQEMELQHRDAVEMLRHQMNLDHSIQDLRLREQHTADLAALRQRNQQQVHWTPY